MRERISPWHDLLACLELVRLIRRERFTVVHTHCSKAGLSIGSMNALDWWVWHCRFEGCRVGATNCPDGEYGGGHFHIYESVFRGSTEADITVGHANYLGIRNNTSINSKAFFVAKRPQEGRGKWADDDTWGAEIKLQGNRILDPHDADPIRLAADLLIEAEHGTDTSVVLLSTSEQLASAVDAALAGQLDDLPAARAEAARAALGVNGGCVLVDDLPTAVAVANEYAHEHLQVAVSDDAVDSVVDALVNAGEILIGPGTESLTRHIVRATPLGAQEARGFPEGVNAWRVGSAVPPKGDGNASLLAEAD